MSSSEPSSDNPTLSTSEASSPPLTTPFSLSSFPAASSDVATTAAFAWPSLSDADNPFSTPLPDFSASGNPFATPVTDSSTPSEEQVNNNNVESIEALTSSLEAGGLAWAAETWASGSAVPPPVWPGSEVEEAFDFSTLGGESMVVEETKCYHWKCGCGGRNTSAVERCVTCHYPRPEEALTQDVWLCPRCFEPGVEEDESAQLPSLRTCKKCAGKDQVVSSAQVSASRVTNSLDVDKAAVAELPFLEWGTEQLEDYFSNLRLGDGINTMVRSVAPMLLGRGRGFVTPAFPDATGASLAAMPDSTIRHRLANRLFPSDMDEFLYRLRRLPVLSDPEPEKRLFLVLGSYEEWILCTAERTHHECNVSGRLLANPNTCCDGKSQHSGSTNEWPQVLPSGSGRTEDRMARKDDAASLDSVPSSTNVLRVLHALDSAPTELFFRLNRVEFSGNGADTIVRSIRAHNDAINLAESDPEAAALLRRKVEDMTLDLLTHGGDHHTALGIAATLIAYPASPVVGFCLTSISRGMELQGLLALFNTETLAIPLHRLHIVKSFAAARDSTGGRSRVRVRRRLKTSAPADADAAAPADTPTPASTIDTTIRDNVKHLCECLSLPTCAVEDLALRNSALLRAETELLQTALRANQSLRRLHISGLGRSSSLTRIFSALEQHPSLQFLRPFFRLTGKSAIAVTSSLAQLLVMSPSLTVLHMCVHDFCEEELEIFGRALEQNTTVTDLCVRASELGESGGKMLGSVLSKNRTLLRVCARSSHLGPKGVEAVCRGLIGNNTLIWLDLALNNSTAAGVLPLADALRGDTALQHLNLTANHIVTMVPLAEALKQNRTLQTVVLDDNGLGDDTGIVVAAALPHHPTITTLRLANNALGPRTLSSLARNLYSNSKIQTLTVRTGWNYFPDHETAAGLDVGDWASAPAAAFGASASSAPTPASVPEPVASPRQALLDWARPFLSSVQLAPSGAFIKDVSLQISSLQQTLSTVPHIDDLHVSRVARSAWKLATQISTAAAPNLSARLHVPAFSDLEPKADASASSASGTKRVPDAAASSGWPSFHPGDGDSRFQPDARELLQMQLDEQRIRSSLARNRVLPLLMVGFRASDNNVMDNHVLRIIFDYMDETRAREFTEPTSAQEFRAALEALRAQYEISPADSSAEPPASTMNVDTATQAQAGGPELYPPHRAPAAGPGAMTFDMPHVAGQMAQYDLCPRHLFTAVGSGTITSDVVQAASNQMAHAPSPPLFDMQQASPFAVPAPAADPYALVDDDEEEDLEDTNNTAQS